MDVGLGYLGQKIVLMFGIVYRFRVVLLALMISSCSQEQEGLPYYDTPDFTPRFSETTDSIQPHIVGGFSMTDQTGATITQEDVRGKIHVASFLFTTCTSICPTMTSQLQRIQTAFKDELEVQLLSFSVTPWVDSVPRLQEFGERFQANPSQWHLLTGSKSTIYDLARTQYYAEEEIGFTRDSSDFVHTEHLILVDRNGRIRGLYNGTLPLEVDHLIGDIRWLLRH